MKKEVILGVTGSIACYKALDVLSSLCKKDIQVTVIMTAEAKEFVGPISFQALSGRKVIDGLFSTPEEWTGAHISLAEKADIILIAPATANIIGKLANGICDDILTCTVISAKAKVIIAPAMNENMYKNAIVQQNIKRLKDLGFKFVGPIRGRLACGYEGLGHIAEAPQIVKEVLKALR